MRRSNNLKNVIIYCRESRDDGFENYDRIETQRDILIEFCRKKNLGNIIDIIMDDNKSGTNFDRLNPIKEKILRKEVDVLLCKDASRLGRNILESLTFTEFLATHNVELVFESERYDEDMFPLIAWFNERRVKDDSTKIRRVLKHKMEEGSVIIKAPYGYIKDGNQLKVDPDSALIIQEIFNLYVDGRNMCEISFILNQKGYLTPSQLKSQYRSTTQTHIWNKQHIARILKHMIYTGDMPYGMREKVSYKSKKFVRKQKEDWIVVENHHEAIISREIFEKAQSKMQRYTQVKPRKSNNKTFSGLLFCGRCGSRMLKIERKRMKPSYVCGKSHREGCVKDDIKEHYGCDTHRVAEEDLVLLVEQYIDKMLHDKQFQAKLSFELDNCESAASDIKKQIKICENKIQDLQRKASLVYDDKLNGTIPEYLFKEKVDAITKDLCEYETRLKDYEKSFIDLEKQADSRYTIESIVNEIHQTGISHDTVSMIFKKILISNPKDITEDCKEEYNLTDNEYLHIQKNGGIIFVQNFVYNCVFVDYELAV